MDTRNPTIGPGTLDLIKRPFNLEVYGKGQGGFPDSIFHAIGTVECVGSSSGPEGHSRTFCYRTREDALSKIPILKKIQRVTKVVLVEWNGEIKWENRKATILFERKETASKKKKKGS